MAKKAKQKKIDRKKRKKHKNEIGALFIPAGLFIGMGLGFFYNQLVVGMFLGLGAGFLLFAIISLFKKRK